MSMLVIAFFMHVLYPADAPIFGEKPDPASILTADIAATYGLPFIIVAIDIRLRHRQGKP